MRRNPKKKKPGASRRKGCGGGDKTPAGPDGSTVDLARDEAAMALVGAKLDSLIGQRPADIAKAALAYIQSLPDFKASGISEDGSVWAQFQDGVLLSIGTNDVDLDIQPAPVAPVAPVKAAPPASKRASTQPAVGGEIPGSAAGYKVVRGTGSLKDWRGVSEAGLVFAACHGTRIPDGGEKVYYLQASDLHVKGDKTHAADLPAHRMAFDMVAVDDEPLVRGKLPKTH